MKHGVLMVVMLAATCICMAQRHHWEVALNSSYMMTNNSQYSRYNAIAFGADVAWWYTVTGNEWWMQRRHYPSFGIKVSYEHIPDGIAGDRAGFVGLIRTPLLPWLEWNIGPGLSFYARSSKETGNAENVFISSRLNCLVDFGLTAHIDEMTTLGVRVLHTSNGMLSRPNQGLNFLQIDVGWKFGDLRRMPFENYRDTVYRRHELGFMLSGGAAMTRYEQMYGHYPCYDLSLNYQYYLDPTFSVGATLDLWYNFSNNKLKQLYCVEYPLPLYVSMMPMVESFWGSVSIKTGIGPVLLASDLVRIRFYERLGIYYNWGRHYAGVGLNAHAGQVEFIEWSWGMRFGIS